MLKLLVDKRMLILAFMAAGLYFGISAYHISLWYVLIAGVVLGVVFGKVFCRWVCPLGLMMEFIMGANPDGKLKAMYQYHKVGCPIAWISGWLNKYSFFRIKVNNISCKNCGICDNECYIVAMEPVKYSLYKPQMEHPGESFTCSKCLKCVAKCPNGSLTYKV
jgi:hypothetical protein